MPVLSVTDAQAHEAMIARTDFSRSAIRSLDEFLAETATVLPFRVAFRNIDFAGYSPSSPPPIGIAVIGVNNYIL